MTSRIDRARLRALLLALLVFFGVVVAILSCGNNDLYFPGDIPFTATPQNTSTPDNSEN